MLVNICIALCLLLATTAIHAEGMILALRLMERIGLMRPLSKRLHRSRIYPIGAVVLLMFLASVAEVTVWAATYLSVNAVAGFEQALYFSMVTYTTLGYGDIVLDERWRLLASFEAANGIIMFGWSTAVVIAAVQRIYFGRRTVTVHTDDGGIEQQR